MKWLRELGFTHLLTGLSWSDCLRPEAEKWFDRQMKALESFEVTVTYFADFRGRMTRRYA